MSDYYTNIKYNSIGVNHNKDFHILYKSKISIDCNCGFKGSLEVDKNKYRGYTIYCPICTGIINPT